MSIIKVTASMTFEYDTREGVIATEDDALQDIEEFIMSHDYGPDFFEYTTEVTP